MKSVFQKVIPPQKVNDIQMFLSWNELRRPGNYYYCICGSAIFFWQTNNAKPCYCNQADRRF